MVLSGLIVTVPPWLVVAGKLGIIIVSTPFSMSLLFAKTSIFNKVESVTVTTVSFPPVGRSLIHVTITNNVS